MNVPYYILLIPYVMGVLLFFFWMFFNIWHLFKFGFFDFVGKLNGLVFIAFAVGVLTITALLLKEVDWLAEVNLISIPSTLIQLPGLNNDL